MKLVYQETGKEVQVGDQVKLKDSVVTVDSFRKPHKPDSEGKISVKFAEGGSAQYYVSVIGAEWIEREDREVDA